MRTSTFNIIALLYCLVFVCTGWAYRYVYMPSAYAYYTSLLALLLLYSNESTSQWRTVIRQRLTKHLDVVGLGWKEVTLLLTKSTHTEQETSLWAAGAWSRGGQRQRWLADDENAVEESRLSAEEMRSVSRRSKQRRLRVAVQHEKQKHTGCYSEHPYCCPRYAMAAVFSPLIISRQLTKIDQQLYGTLIGG